MTLLHIYDLTEPTLLTFLAVVIRVGFLLIFLPFWGDMTLPASVRILLVMAVSMVLTPVVRIDLAAFPTTFGTLLLAIGFEAAFGFSVAFLIQLVFAAVQIAGQISGEQMGFAIANVLSPDQSSQVTIVTQVKYVFATLLFFMMNFHLLLFRALAHSFEIVPPFHGQPGLTMVALVNQMATGMFSTAIQMAAPILATMVFVDVALGLINKAVPQVNVFMESFPVRIVLGLFMLSSVLVALARLLQNYFGQLDRFMTAMMKAWA